MEAKHSNDKLVYRNHDVSMCLAHTAHVVYWLECGIWHGPQIGQMKHSKNLKRSSGHLWPDAIKERAKNFLSPPLQQTGFRPAVDICPDKCTYNHWTRQVTTQIVVVPDAPDVIDVRYISHPVLKNHGGYGLAVQITWMLDTFKIKGSNLRCINGWPIQ